MYAGTGRVGNGDYTLDGGNLMTIHEYGADKEKVIVLIHPSVVMWDYFEYVIPGLQEKYHLIIPALPGYDEEHPYEDFTSVEEIADDLAEWLIAHKIKTVDVLYGCSMGGAVVLKMIAEQKIVVNHAVCDGGITPYQLPWLITRVIAVKDFLMVSMGKIGGLGMLEKAFSTDEYSKEDLVYMAKVFRFISYKTIWNTFESCNNYDMPKNMPEYKGHLQYWYGDKEAKDRAWDRKYVRKHFPKAEFIEFKNMGHASMASLYPQKMVEQLDKETIV
jgi:pimeloyl-ACP methyl ester carboxylesterase